MPYRIFHLEDVADYLHIGVHDIEELVHHREIPCEQQGGRLIFRKKEIDAWASQRILGLPEKRLEHYHRSSEAKARKHLGNADTLIGELLQEAWIEPRLLAKTRAAVVRDLADLAAKTGQVGDQELFLDMLKQRESLCSTGLGGGFALLHPRHHEPYLLAESFVLLARAPYPVLFGAPDGGKTDVFFLIGCQDDRIHLHVLARLCVMCTRTPLLAELRAAGGRHEMYAAIMASEQAVTAQAARSAS